MLRDLRELNRVIIGINEILTDNGALIKNVIEHCSRIVLGGAIANHQDTIDFAIRVGLLTKQNDRLFTTDLADKFLDYNKERNYSLTDSQRELLVQKCFFSEGMSVELREILLQFTSVPYKKTFEWSKSNGIRFAGNKNLLNLMYQARILFQSDETVLINPQYAALASYFRTSRKQMTQIEFREKLAEREEIGSVAEEIAVDYERKRLSSAGLKVESEMVQSIVDVDVGAGYDVMSFDGEGLNYNRFIEVKGSRSSNVSFVWSRNEMRIAKKLKTKYWIYFIGRINLRQKSSRMDPVLIRNPANRILDSNDYNKDCLHLSIRRISKKAKTNLSPYSKVSKNVQ